MNLPASAVPWRTAVARCCAEQRQCNAPASHCSLLLLLRSASTADTAETAVMLHAKEATLVAFAPKARLPQVDAYTENHRIVAFAAKARLSQVHTVTENHRLFSTVTTDHKLQNEVWNTLLLCLNSEGVTMRFLLRMAGAADSAVLLELEIERLSGAAGVPSSCEQQTFCAVPPAHYLWLLQPSY